MEGAANPGMLNPSPQSLSVLSAKTGTACVPDASRKSSVMAWAFSVAKIWRAELASDLRFPQYKMSLIDAINKRLRANYIYLFMIMLAGWILKLVSHPQSATSWKDFISHAAVGPIPGELTLLFLLAFLLHLFYLARRISHPSDCREIIHPHH